MILAKYFRKEIPPFGSTWSGNASFRSVLSFLKTLPEGKFEARLITTSGGNMQVDVAETMEIDEKEKFFWVGKIGVCDVTGSPEIEMTPDETVIGFECDMPHYSTDAILRIYPKK